MAPSRSPSRRRSRSRSRSRDRRDRSRNRSRTPSPSRERRRHRSRSRSVDNRDRRRGRSRSSSRDRPRRRQRDAASDDSDDGERHKRDKETEKKARKAEKKRLKKEKEEYQEKLSELLGYSNTSNPYGDVSLHEKFQWHKKRELEEKVLGLTEHQAAKRDLARRKETMLELEKLKKRRAEREEEHAMHEQEMLRMQREREREAYGDLEQKENDFHLNQAKVRAQIRIREGRAKPIDIMAMAMNLDYDDVSVTIDEPYKIFVNLSLAEVDELKNDIQLYLELAKDKSTEFWENMLVVCQDELDKLRASRVPNARSGQPGILDAVHQDINSMLENKTTNELNSLQKSIINKLASGAPVDVEYWEALLKAIVVYKCKARIREMHQHALLTRLELLRARQREEAMLAQEMLAASLVSEFPATPNEMAVEPSADVIDLGDEEETAGQTDTGSDRPSSPLLLSRAEDLDLDILEEEDDLTSLMAKRVDVRNNKFMSLTSRTMGSANMQKVFADGMDQDSTEEKLYQLEKAKDMDPSEQAFNIEVPWAPQVYMWQDKYRPRKPRYFNRVQTGYEWNKYNQTHYDHDNPPPKVVQGYKFNLFFPDLINKKEAPTYKLLPDSESKDGSTCILLFHAGPPYEDIAFRVVNREWEMSHKKGFRSSFDKGILSLHFHFVRYRYRK